MLIMVAGVPTCTHTWGCKGEHLARVGTNWTPTRDRQSFLHKNIRTSILFLISAQYMARQGWTKGTILYLMEAILYLFLWPCFQTKLFVIHVSIALFLERVGTNWTSDCQSFLHGNIRTSILFLISAQYMTRQGWTKGTIIYLVEAKLYLFIWPCFNTKLIVIPVSVALFLYIVLVQTGKGIVNPSCIRTLEHLFSF